jgi:hypothetical protein
LKPGRPDLANFRPLVDGLFMGSFLKITEVAHIFGPLFPGLRLSMNLTKMVWAIFWVIFSQTHLVTLLKTMRLENKRLKICLVSQNSLLCQLTCPLNVRQSVKTKNEMF